MNADFKENVLVVDDDRDIVEAIARLLEKEGYNIYRAYDGLQALEVLGLSVGADDYISKPYNPMELIARVKSGLRRYLHFGTLGTGSFGQGQKNVIVIGGLELYLDDKRLLVDGENVKLTATEFKITELLMSNPGRVFSAEDIYKKVLNMRNSWK